MPNRLSTVDTTEALEMPDDDWTEVLQSGVPIGRYRVHGDLVTVQSRFEPGIEMVSRHEGNAAGVARGVIGDLIARPALRRP